MQFSSHISFRLGHWHVQPSLNRISDGDRSVRITPKAMDVLCCMAMHGNDVVSREDLMETVWPDVVVNEDVLTRAISDLRKALEGGGAGSGLIETVPKRGYRLTGTISYPANGDSAPEIATSIDVRVDRHASKAPVSPLGAQPFRLGVSLFAILTLLVLAWRLYPAPDPANPFDTYSPPFPVTSLPGTEMLPALSPDGSQVAFSWTGPEGGDHDIYVALVGDGTPLLITDGDEFDHSPTWHPDGSQLAYLSRTDDDCTIYVVSALGGPRRKVTTCGENISGDLAWSPDGNWLAFADRPAAGASFGIVLYSLSTEERVQLTAPDSQHWGDSSPDFSPDGTQVAFQRSVSMATQDLYVVGTDGGEPVRLSEQSTAFRGHTWSSDGQGIIASAGLNGSLNLWLFPLEGGTPKWIPQAGQDAFRPHAAGSMLVFERRGASTDIMAWSASTDTAQAWGASTRSEMHPTLSPDGDRVAFISDRSGNPELWVAERDGSSALQLTFFGGPFVGSPDWSPDGTRLAFDARPEGHADVYVVDSQGGRPRRLTSYSSNELNAAWSSDGSSLYFGSNRSGIWQIWRMPAGGGEPMLVTTEGGYSAEVDSTSVYFTRYDQPGIWKTSEEEADPVRVLEAGPTSHDGWDLYRGEILYASQDSIVRFDLASRLITRMAAPGILREAGLSISPDGTGGLYVVSSSEEIDLVGLKRLERAIR